MPDISRRMVLRAGAGLAAFCGVAGVRSGCAAAPGPESLTTLIDCNRCDGCAQEALPLCVAACRERALASIPDPATPIPRPFPRGMIEDWSGRKDVHDRLTPYTQLFVERVELEGPGARTLYLPRRCMHCDNPACATICPFAANHKFPNGAVVINTGLCFGGAKCRDVCPWEIPQRQSGLGIYLSLLPTFAGNGVMYKCDLCYDRLLERRLPLCIAACPHDAMIIGQRRDIVPEAQRRAMKTGGFLYGKDENGGTATIYLSPVPFDRINAALATGPGRPHFDPVERRLARVSALEASVLLSPFVGAAAGIAAALFALRRRAAEGREEKVSG